MPCKSRLLTEFILTANVWLLDITCRGSFEVCLIWERTKTAQPWCSACIEVLQEYLQNCHYLERSKGCSNFVLREFGGHAMVMCAKSPKCVGHSRTWTNYWIHVFSPFSSVTIYVVGFCHLFREVNTRTLFIFGWNMKHVYMNLLGRIPSSWKYSTCHKNRRRHLAYVWAKF